MLLNVFFHCLQRSKHMNMRRHIYGFKVLLSISIVNIIATLCAVVSRDTVYGAEQPMAHTYPTSKRIETRAVEVAALRHLFTHYGNPRFHAVYFVGMMPDHDPDEGLLNAFHSNKPIVKKASQSRYSALGVWDRKTGKKGVLFRISQPAWKARNRILIKGRVLWHTQGAVSVTCTLIHTSKGWAVKNETVTASS
jgi:hypothetical protein